MKAYVLEDINKLVYKDVDIPKCSRGWALVKVKASGICSSDIPRIYKKGTYHFPTIPGHEFSGIVESVGDEKDKKYIGKKVGVFPLIPCRKCIQCLNKHYEMCSNYDYIGSRRDGGFSEYVSVPIWNLIELNDNIDFIEAAMLEPISVALHAIKQGKIKQGDSVGIIGTGMIGFAAAQWAKKMGAGEVTIIGRSKLKKEYADKLDINYLVTNSVKEEFDIVLEAVGSGQAIDLAINITKAGGTLILMGNPTGDILLSQNTYWRILRKQISIIGTWNSFYEHSEQCDWSEAVEALQNNEIRVKHLISHKFDQEHLVNGLELMLKHNEPYCKVMTIWNEE